MLTSFILKTCERATCCMHEITVRAMRRDEMTYAQNEMGRTIRSEAIHSPTVCFSCTHCHDIRKGEDLQMRYCLLYYSFEGISLLLTYSTYAAKVFLASSPLHLDMN